MKRISMMTTIITITITITTGNGAG
ncbi:TPA: thr operon leader peptide [Raoultella ornithinolytica]|nr:thr operon leader peptide [Raoultella ornithinolytica]HDT6554825.1 thr operon leader peptide [Raoultella ornithinolytica]